jgi:hypothetical protein
MNVNSNEMEREIEKLRTALAINRQHCRKLAEENELLRAGRGHPPPEQVLVNVHPDLMPPPPPEPKKRQQRRHLYDGDRPLRTQWPLLGDAA